MFAGIPNFSLFISTAWLNSPLNKATHDTCDLHNHTSPEQPSRKTLDRQFWKLERFAYLAMETDIDRDNVRWSIGIFNNPPGIWPSHVPGEGGVRICGDANFDAKVVVLRFNKTKRFAVFRNFRVISMRFAVCACYSVWCLYVMLCTFAVFVPRLCPLTGERSIWRLPGWSEVFELEMWVRWRSVKVKNTTLAYQNEIEFYIFVVQ